jgi:formylglycine-generating enzyme required for sulfatase activity/dienelactone hydrolase
MKIRGQSVWQVLGLYLAGGWVLLQVADVLVDNVGLPPRVFTLALVLLAIGFPIALITAVVQGSGRDSERSEEAQAPRDTRSAGTALALFTWKNVALGTLMASALWGIVAIGWMIRSGDASEKLEEQARLEDEIQGLAELRMWDSAWAVARAAGIDPQDDLSAGSIVSTFTHVTAVRTDPAGAAVYVNSYAADREWDRIGITPLDSARIPLGVTRLRIELEGHRPLELGTFEWLPTDSTYRLVPESADSTDMVWVPGGEYPIQSPGLEHVEPPLLGGFWIDRLEVTNREFKRFVDAGGYGDPTYWTEPFEKDGRTLGFTEAVEQFTDRTGRQGPATWEAGDYPDGEADHPVTGLSWYEAAAYADWAGKRLPTVFHWNRAAGTLLSSHVVPHSNFSGDGPSRVGQYDGVGPYGTLDMGGNAREWCWNEGIAGRFILGGGWNDATYMFNDAFEQPAWDRSVTNGLRLAIYRDEDIGAAGAPIERPLRDFLAEEPVSDETYRVFLGMYAYDPTPLNATVEARDKTPEDWIRERISFDAAYGGERMLAHLFLPKNTEPPFQAVVFFPGSGAIYRDSLVRWSGGFLVQDGRAVIVPVYDGIYERRDDLDTDMPNETVAYRDRVIRWYQDLGRSVDYLESREDIDTGKLAYFGHSWGGRMGVLMTAVEPRFDAAVFYVAGLKFQRALPEADPFNYVTRLTIPVLMLNGRHDMFFPLETSQKPMYQLLGTPEAQKRHVVAEGGHDVPRALLIRETLDWLDTYLGPVER